MVAQRGGNRPPFPQDFSRLARRTLQGLRRAVCMETYPQSTLRMRTTCAEDPEIDPRRSWQNCKYARWKSGAAFGFWEAGDDDCAGFGDLIEMSEQLDLIMVRAQNVSLERVIVFRRGDAGIGVGGFVA